MATISMLTIHLDRDAAPRQESTPELRTKRLQVLRRRRNGYVLLSMSTALAAVLGASGLAIDLGRMYITRSEAQAFADSAALAAAAQLDGTSVGITAANLAVQNNPNRWNLGTQNFSDTSVQFGLASAANQNTADPNSWTSNPESPANYRFVLVVANAAVPVTLMQAITGQSTARVSAAATGGQVMVTTYMDGLLPFSPIAPNTADTANYGYVTGQVYTLRYPSNGGLNAGNVCAGDVGASYTNNLPSQDRGFWGGNSSAVLRGEIVDDYQSTPMTIGADVPMVGGVRTTEGSALDTRVREDTDSSSMDYASYKSNGQGNGRRIIGAPVNGGAPGFTAVAIRAFFLQPAGVYSSVTGSMPICAEYIGTYIQAAGVHTGAVAGTGGLLVRLTQ
jgi:Putative Flp pilus-assembly TadE/G-like